MAIHLNLLIFYKRNYFLEFTFCLSEWGSIQVHPWLAAKRSCFSSLLLLLLLLLLILLPAALHYLVLASFWEMIVKEDFLEDTQSSCSTGILFTLRWHCITSFLFSPSHKCLIDCALELYCCFALKKKKKCTHWQCVSKALGGNQQFSIHEWIHPND